MKNSGWHLDCWLQAPVRTNRKSRIPKPPVGRSFGRRQQVVVRPNFDIKFGEETYSYNSAKARPAVTKAATWSVP